ncbi:MAG: LysR family transcriptional regulator [Pseudomonadota bacterium]
MSVVSHPAFDLDWNLVRTFVAVAEAGSLAAGALVMGITHPTAARHITQLEEHLGQSLFTRTGKGLKLNEVGARLEAYAKAMHQQALEFASASDAVRAEPVRSVRISVAQMVSEMIPEVIFGELIDSDVGYSGRVELQVTNDLANLLQRDADFAIRHVRPEQQELVCRQVGALRLGLFASEEYLNLKGQLTLERVQEHRFVDGLSRDHLIRGAARHGVEILPEQICFLSDCLGGQRAAVRSGAGIGAFPIWMVEHEPGFVEVLAKDALIEMEVWLVARPEARDNLQLKAMFSCLGDALYKRLHQEQAANS